MWFSMVKMAAGQNESQNETWKHELKPAVPWWFNLRFAVDVASPLVLVANFSLLAASRVHVGPKILAPRKSFSVHPPDSNLTS